MKITLVFPRFKYPSGDISLGLAGIAGYIRQKLEKAEVRILDTTFNSSWEYVEEFFEEFRPDIVAIYVGTLMFNDAVKVAKIAKKFGANVIGGGPHATIMPGTVIKESSFDAICIGEGEETFVDYIKTFYKDRLFEKVKGIWFKKNSKIHKNPPREPIHDIDILPMPAYDLFDMEKYMNYFFQLDSYSPKLKGISIIASRGCPFNCAYCQPTLRKIFGKRFRMRSPKKVVEELKLLKKEFAVNSFFFTDDTFTVSKKWVKEFCELMKKENLGLIWGCNTRADTIDYEMMKWMKETGCVKLRLGIESVTDRIRNGIYNKNISMKQINDLLNNAKKLKIQVAAYFMLGAPTETPKEVWDTIKFAARSSLVEANFSITTPLPDTGLYNYVLDKGWSLPKDFDSYDYYQVKRPQMSDKEISVEKLTLYKKIANFYFFLNPRRIFITLKSIWGIQGFKKLLLKIGRI